MKQLFAASAVTTALALVSIGIAEEKDRPRPKTLTGQVSKIDAGALTVLQRGDSGERSTTFTLSPQTKILVQTDADEKIKGGEGGERIVAKTREGKIADVKVEQRVTVSFIETGKADSILVLHAPKPRKGERN